MVSKQRIFFSISRGALDKYSLPVGRAHAVTDQLRDAFPDEEDEELDMITLLAAADDNVAGVEGEPFRLVVAADVRATYVGTDSYPSLVKVTDEVTWADVAAIFVDDEDAAEVIVRARNGDEEACEESAGIDLLWYDPSERLRLSAELAHRMS